MPVSSFISRAACRGHRPAHLAACVVHERPALVAQLLKDRDVARFIVAPSGYGKTFLAAEYADTVHAWAHTFWVNAQSPCFVRDLDAEDVAASCLAFDGDSALVVFDDVPALDPARQELFSGEVDRLLAEGCEVLVTCVPSCDAAGALQRDRLRLGAGSLLLDDAELDAVRSPDDRSRRPADSIGPACRVPLLAWGPDEARAERFAQGAMGEDVPADLLLVMAGALVLQEGAAVDLAPFGPLDEPMLEDVARDYPHLGLDGDLERFEAPKLDMAVLAGPLRKRLAELVSRSSSSSPEQLARAWALALMRKGRSPRACAVMREVCPRRGRAVWALDNSAELVRQACFFPMLRLLDDREGTASEARMRLDALEALCCMVLGDERESLRYAKRNVSNDVAPEGARVLSQLVAVRVDAGAVAARACKGLRAEAEASAGADARSCSRWQLLAQAWHASSRGLVEMSRLWEGFAEAQVDEDVLCICASWLFGLHEGSEAESSAEASLARRHAERFVRRRLAARAENGAIDYFTASAGLALEEAHARGTAYEGGPLEAGLLIQLRQVEMSVLSQRRMLDEKASQEQARRSDWAATHSTAAFDGAAPSQARSERSVPLLMLRMFGRFEVSLGGMPVDYRQFRRQNTRALLVLLAVNQGRELSRDAVAEAMWPQSTEAVAHKNFYTVWAQLRRALSLPDGTCPYLVRHQYGCSLNARYVQSDVDRLNEICRELLFTTPNIERWSTLFSEVDRDFSSDLMPSERKNALIIRARNDYKTRLVDALVAATMSVVGSENSQWGVWFARAAVGRDETREDAYIALMRAQISVNQRTAAMMTYLRCRRVLSEQLGIDPAPETTALYESLLDSPERRGAAYAS